MKSEHEKSAARGERTLLSRVVVAALKSSTPTPAAGEAASPFQRGSNDSVASLEERAAAGDATAERELILRRRLEDVPRRVAAALALERLDVALADGSSLTLDESERLLASKEDQRAHMALRRSVDEATRSFRHFRLYRSDDATRELAKPFLAATAPLAAAAREALGALGGAPLEDPGSLARGLDLPDANGVFGDDATRALAAVVRGALRTPPSAIRVPRAMTGACLDGRYAWPTGMRRCDRHLRTLEALGTAAAFAQGQGEPAVRAAPAAFGFAAALALSSSPVRQASGTDRRQAERAARICAATFVLRARARIALAQLPEDAHTDEAREIVIAALGVDPGHALLVQLAEPPWTTVDDELPHAFMHAPTYALALRDAFDETWSIRRDAWDVIGEAVQPVDVEAKDAAIRLAAAWMSWASELL